MESNEKDAVLSRLKDGVTHLNQIVTSIEQDQVNCIDTINAIKMVQASLAQAHQILISGEFRSCSLLAVQAKELSEQERILLEISELISVADWKHSRIDKEPK